MAQYPKAEWRGPIPNVGGTMSTVRLFVVHIMSGTLTGTDSWFHNKAAQVSAHFGVGKTGTVYQWVDTSETAWAEMAYNDVAISIEHEGQSGDSLTQAQLAASLALLDWLHSQYPAVPLLRTSDPNGTGVIGHGELGVAGGDHLLCPGQPVLTQFDVVLKPKPAPKPVPPTPAQLAAAHLVGLPNLAEADIAKANKWDLYVFVNGHFALYNPPVPPNTTLYANVNYHHKKPV